MRTKLVTLFLISVIALLMAVSVSANNEQPELLPEEIFEELGFPVEPSIPGRIEGAGTYFEIKDSEYLNITLKSSEEIKVVLESIPRMISLNVEAATDGINSTELTLKGLEPSKTYYKYQDSYRNGVVFISDENGSYNWVQDLTQPHHVWFQEEKGTIFLPEDCSKYGSWNPTTLTCTLNQNLNQSVEITASNITLDGNSHTITGTGTGYGIYLNRKTGVTLKNIVINNFSSGIYLYNSSNNILTNITANLNYSYGIYLYWSSNNTFTNITANSNSQYGIRLDYGSNNTLTSITANSNNYGIRFHSSSNNQLTSIIANSNWFYGIYLHFSSNNIFIDITTNSNQGNGIYFTSSSNNQLTNIETNSNARGIYLYLSSGNIIYLNNFVNNTNNVYSYNSINTWNSPEKINYSYNNKNYVNYLGNYWSDYVGNDANNDGIGDVPYTFTGDQDSYPLMMPFENYFEVPPNQPPTISNLGQFKSDSIISITEGNATTESTVVFKAVLSDPDNDKVKFQVELRQMSEPFTGIDDGGILNSEFLDSGSETTITREGFINGQYHWRARAVDFQGNASEWQEFGETGNVDFEVKLVSLYTQVRSPYPSDDETKTWADEIYAKGDVESYNCGSKIRQCGCAITSVVMIARFYDIIEAQNKDMNPKEINQWLKNELGGYVNGGVNWIAAAKYTDWRIKYEKTNKVPNNYALLDERLNNNQPVIARANAGRGGINLQHFFVIDNKLTVTYGVKDPGWYNTQKLNETTNTANKVRGYENGFDGLRIYKKGDGIAQSAITIALGSPAELLITDSLGRKLGKDKNGVEYQEIPDGWYFEDGFDDPTGEILPSQERNKLIYILEPLDGQYQLEVIGTGEGAYTLQSTSYDTQGNSQNQEFQSETAPNYTAQYNLSFDSSNSNNTTIELFDETPPEAEIYFNQNIQQLIVKGVDNITVNPTIGIIELKKEVIYQIQDEAGNITKLFFERLKQEGKEIKAELRSIQYNDNPIINLSKTELKYEWSLDKKINQIKELEQEIKVKGQFKIKAKYQYRKDETKVNITEIEIEREKEKKVTKQTLPGLVIIKLITKSGVLEFNF